MRLEELRGDWDVVVVGAGVAGTMSALHLARSKLRVLLVEKSHWPRDKVCGGCLNAAAVRALTAAGIHLQSGHGYTGMHLGCRERVANLPLPEGQAISRNRLDAILADHAINSGAWFVSETRASPGNTHSAHREVLLRSGSQTRTITARLVLDCSGLASRLLSGIEWRVAPRARIGMATSVRQMSESYHAGVIHMACARHGYVGLVRAEDGITNIAAAVDPTWCADMGGPAEAIRSILATAGFPAIDGLRELHWHGTPQLTRTRRALGADRVLILGDAAGYVEPFTGEGMAWAITDAASVLPLARESVARWENSIIARWSAVHSRNLRARQRVCRGVSHLLRHPRLLSAALPVLNAAPAVISPLSAWLNRDLRSGAMVQS